METSRCQGISTSRRCGPISNHTPALPLPLLPIPIRTPLSHLLPKPNNPCAHKLRTPAFPPTSIVAMEDDDYYSSGDEYGLYSDDAEIDEGFDGDVIEDGSQCACGTPSVQIITKESLLAAQREDLRRVMELLPLSEQYARTLLIYHRWDVDRLLGVLVDKGKERLFSEAGVTIVEHKDSAMFNSSSPIICKICFDEVPAHTVTMMDCGHYFCNNCWTVHFIVQINDGQSRRIRCMTPKCKAICNEAVVQNLVRLKDPELADRFERFILESYIEDNSKVKWCPSVPHCGNAIRVDGDDTYCEVECTCGKQFCFSCLAVAHSPCSCLMWKLWSRKCRDESETVNWITVHTKPCPKCHKHVEKNGGCNLVSCVCGQAFCWLCGGATGREHTWTSIRGHSCGRYKDDEVKNSERAKHELHRYIHYHNRYKVHMDSFKAESKLKETIQGRITVSESKESNIKDYSWVMNGLDRLFRSRRVLSYSYPFAFYMFGNELFKDEMTSDAKEIKKNLFEDQQQQLECNVERLSKVLEEPFDTFAEEKVLEIRLHIINLSVLVDKLCIKMYECIENDLLGSLRTTIHNISPYRSKGVERATELSISCGSDSSFGSNVKNVDFCQQWHSGTNPAGGTEPARSGSMKHALLDIHDSGVSTKRARKDSLRGDGLFDLNMPPK